MYHLSHNLIVNNNCVCRELERTHENQVGDQDTAKTVEVMSVRNVFIMFIQFCLRFK